MKRLLSFTIVVLALTFGTGTQASADPGAQVLLRPPATDEVLLPQAACDHASDRNRNFNARHHHTGVKAGDETPPGGTPPTCDEVNQG